MIRWMAEHKVAANLLMIIIIFTGVLGVRNIKFDLIDPCKLNLLFPGLDGAEEDPVKIKEELESKVRPAVARVGGDIKFRSFNDGIVTVELQGSCSGCPSSIVTLKRGVENMLKHYVPEVNSVESI